MSELKPMSLKRAHDLVRRLAVRLEKDEVYKNHLERKINDKGICIDGRACIIAENVVSIIHEMYEKELNR